MSWDLANIRPHISVELSKAARKVEIESSTRWSYPQGLAWGHGLEHLVVDRSLRKPNVKITCSAVRDEDKSVEILLQKLARIGFQVPYS